MICLIVRINPLQRACWIQKFDNGISYFAQNITKSQYTFYSDG